MYDNLAPNITSYEQLLAILRQRAGRRLSQPEQDYFQSLFNDLLLLDAELRMKVSADKLERGH